MPDIYEGNNRRITSTSQAKKGSILFGTSAYDEANNMMGIGTAEPSVALEVAGDILAEDVVADSLEVEAFTLPTGASAGHVLTSDADGIAGWAALPADPGHGDLSGLADDDHTQYAALNGRSGGQVLTGGTEQGDNLELRSTSSQEGFGQVRIGAHGIVVDESMSDAIGIGCDPQPGAQVQLTGDGDLGITMQRNSAAASPGGSLNLSAGSPLAGEIDQDGGDVVLSTGSSTGTGTAKVQVKAAPAGSTGTDDNAPVVALEVRGDGNVLAGPQAGVAQDAAAGFLCIPIIATGDPTGAPVGIPAGMAAIGYVAVTGKLAVWNGSAWKLITVDA